MEAVEKAMPDFPVETIHEDMASIDCTEANQLEYLEWITPKLIMRDSMNHTLTGHQLCPLGDLNEWSMKLPSPNHSSTFKFEQ